MHWLNKKGIFDIIVKIILVIAFFIVMLIFITNIFGPFIKEDTSDYICKLSVIMRAKTPSFLNMFSLKCNTKEFEIKEKKDMGNAVYDCWSRMGKGKLNFESGGKRVSCFVCSKLNIKNTDLKDFDKEQISVVKKKSFKEFFEENGASVFSYGEFKEGEYAVIYILTQGKLFGALSQSFFDLFHGKMSILDVLKKIGGDYILGSWIDYFSDGGKVNYKYALVRNNPEEGFTASLFVVTKEQVKEDCVINEKG